MEKYGEILERLERNFLEIKKNIELGLEDDLAVQNLTTEMEKDILILFSDLLRLKETVGYENFYFIEKILNNLYEFEGKEKILAFLDWVTIILNPDKDIFYLEFIRQSSDIFSNRAYRIENAFPALKNFINGQERYYKKEKMKNLFFDAKKKKIFPLNLQKLSIPLYKNLKNIEIDRIPFDTQFVVLTGDNGEGKTSLLQGIAVAINSEETKSEERHLKSSISLRCYDDKMQRERWIHERLSEELYEAIYNKVLAYGASRLQIQSEESQDVQDARKSNTYGLFRTDGVLLNIEYWIKMQILDGETARIDAVCDLLTALLPSVDKVVYGKNKAGKFRIAYLQDGEERTMRELSAGNKSILAMIGDIVIRLYETQPEVTDPKELNGIVLIDEFEAHLHPKWQRRLPQLLAEHLPNIQFIVTTHSPIIFLGLPPNSLLFNITKDENKKTVVQRLDIDLANVLPNQLLTSDLFGMDTVRSVQNKGIEDLSVSTQQEVDERKARRERLKALYKNFDFEMPEN